MKSILRQNKLLLSITVIISVISSAAYVYIAIILQRVTDIALSGNMSAFRDIVIQSVLYLLTLGILNYIYSLCSKYLICKIILILRKKLFRGILNRNREDFFKVNTAEYISTFTNDIKLVEENYINPLLILLQNIIIFITALVVLFIISPIIGFFLIGCLFLMLTIPGLFGKALQKRQDIVSKKLSALTSKIKDIFAGYDVIKSYQMNSHVHSQFKEENQETIKARFNADKMVAASESSSEILAYITLFSGFFIGAYLIITGNITAGILLALIQLSSSFVNPLMIIMQCLPLIQGVKPVLKRIENMSDYSDTSFTGTKPPEFNRQIKTENVSFSYNNNQKIIDDISLTIKKNHKYAVIGHSGCGKTTLIKLLTGCYAGFEGNILFDDDNMRLLDINKINEMIAVIHQNIYMFDDNIKNNICLYNEYDENNLTRVLTLSGINKFINNMPDGLASLVGENGCNISGGQRQRIAVARALIQNKPLLILDEGTAAIDMQTAYDIESSLLKLDDLTLITITHNMNYDILSLYDQIIYMEDGKIIESGNLKELLQLNGSFYNFFNLKKE